MRHDLHAGKKKILVGYGWVVLGNGDVPLDEVAFFTTGLTISKAFLEKCGTFFGILREN